MLTHLIFNFALGSAALIPTDGSTCSDIKKLYTNENPCCGRDPGNDWVNYGSDAVQYAPAFRFNSGSIGLGGYPAWNSKLVEPGYMLPLGVSSCPGAGVIAAALMGVVPHTNHPANMSVYLSPPVQKAFALLSELFVAELRMGKSYNLPAGDSPMPNNTQHPDRWSKDQLSNWIASYKTAVDSLTYDPWECEMCANLSLRSGLVMLAALHVSDVAYLSKPIDEPKSVLFQEDATNPQSASYMLYGQSMPGPYSASFSLNYFNAYYDPSDATTLAAGFNVGF
jgi:hypothetical protein